MSRHLFDGDSVTLRRPVGSAELTRDGTRRDGRESKEVREGDNLMKVGERKSIGSFPSFDWEYFFGKIFDG